MQFPVISCPKRDSGGSSGGGQTVRHRCTVTAAGLFKPPDVRVSDLVYVLVHTARPPWELAKTGLRSAPRERGSSGAFIQWALRLALLERFREPVSAVQANPKP